MDKEIGKSGAAKGILGALSLGLERRKKEPRLLLYDSAELALGFIFSRLHIVFGAYPVATSFIAASPRVWAALLGAVIGSLSRGSVGIIHAIINIIVVLLRVIISGGERAEGKNALFGEGLLLRTSASVIGAFIGSVYELLLGGLSGTSILYGISASVLGALFTVAFYGLFSAGVGLDDIIYAKSPVFEKRRHGRELYLWIYFLVSSLLLIFLISVALTEYSLLGIDLVYVFSSFITLFAAKRFGAGRAAVVGFVSSFGASASLSAGFALLGLGAGFFFGIAPLYAFLAGGILLGAWSAYSGGLVGFLSSFPEFASAAALVFPLTKIIDREKREDVREDRARAATDMITSVALAKKSESESGAAALPTTLSSIAASLRRFGKSEGDISFEELSESLIKAAKTACTSCKYSAECKAINPAPLAEIIGDLTTNIYKNRKISHNDEKILPDYCKNHEHIFAAFADAHAGLLSEKFKSQRLSLISEEYELIGKMLNEVELHHQRRWQPDSALSERLSHALFEAGLREGVIKVFGEREKRFIVAGEDKSGDIITSRELRSAIEAVAGVRLGELEFFRRGELALMCCRTQPEYYVEYAESSECARDSDVCGDVATSFTTDGCYFYSLLSDGMGTGELAREASGFVIEFLKSVLCSSVSESSALGILNGIVRSKSVECSATLDLFRLDLLTGEGQFTKSGAVSSFIKRGDSLFRIRSESAPLGLMRKIDSEKIRVEIKSGDTVIMLSDGISDSPESCPWLLELLARDFRGTLAEYADYILAQAKNNSRGKDDMTVALARVKKVIRD